MRLLIVSDAAPARNGAGSYYQDLLPLLAGKLEAIELFSPVIDSYGQWQAGLVLPLPGDATQKLCFPDYRKLQQHFSKLQPDLVVAATPGIFGLSAAMLAGRYGIPFLTGFHTSFEQITELYWPDSWRGKLVEHYFRLSNGYLLKRTAGVIGNSAPVLEQAQRLGAREVHLVGTPLALDFLTSPVRAHSGFIKNCLYAGRLAKEKNLEALLTAAEALPGIKFSVAGDGPMRSSILAAVSRLPNLQYLGWLSRGQLREAVDAHDVLLLPSHFETFGTIALEAMARQRPAIVTSSCGISDWECLRPGLRICESGSVLTRALYDMSEMCPADIKALANTSLNCAHAFNAGLADNWMHLIRNTARTCQAA